MLTMIANILLLIGCIGTFIFFWILTGKIIAHYMPLRMTTVTITEEDGSVREIELDSDTAIKFVKYLEENKI
ncbi:hypothetical protein [Wohlfahrtiimonas chitiniclastica]|uniref:hypothetical protein n=1 Tax=Wohlfahrtiimonas chitiniclastica TaxID=400946 RepID=UPI001BD135C3|nr:hypothetical protein [Wohlfahrtiimonas chitiniclastica]MBS7815862.1 hypothetical protein [Wohlfahrtiimonas chitiniclastica]MBS7822143.1 hypothetical protein [Wohlfahrtiimonas chitiniclastica]MBS7829935.1 hypothetical protein [Wohlfahrtiimonas chitiniclastica]MBS7831902.1 hypothetical protein [Wohlfahrtiimonas chitiniclastica]